MSDEPHCELHGNVKHHNCINWILKSLPNFSKTLCHSDGLYGIFRKFTVGGILLPRYCDWSEVSAHTPRTCLTSSCSQTKDNNNYFLARMCSSTSQDCVGGISQEHVWRRPCYQSLQNFWSANSLLDLNPEFILLGTIS